MNIKQRINEISLGIIVIGLYFTFSLLSNPISTFLKINTMPIPLILTWNIIYEILLVCILILILNKKIKSSIKDIKSNHKEYYSKYFKYYLIGLAIMLISNSIIIFALKNGISDNEQGIRKMLELSPVYIFISGVLIAPVLEELVFRQGFRNIFKNNFLFIFSSGIIFGALHVITSFTSITDLLYLIPYCSLGISFAYIMSKTNNVFVTMGIHFMHNGILVTLQLLALFFG